MPSVANAVVRQEVREAIGVTVDATVDALLVLADQYGPDWAVPLVRDELGRDLADLLHDALVDDGWVFNRARPDSATPRRRPASWSGTASPSTA